MELSDKDEELRRRALLFPTQDEFGIDLTLLDANLRLTPTQRIEKHMRALNNVLEVRRAGRALRFKSSM